MGLNYRDFNILTYFDPIRFVIAVFFWAIFLLSFPLNSFSQNIGINSIGIPPAADAGLDVFFQNKGILIPRVSLASSTDLMGNASLQTGLMVFKNAGVWGAPDGFYYWDGNHWGTSFAGWLLLGNAGSNANFDFLGTTDAQDFVVKTNGVEQMRVSAANGNVGVGTAPSATFKLLVNGDLGTPTLPGAGVQDNIGMWMQGNTGLAGEYKQGVMGNMYFNGANWIGKYDGNNRGFWSVLGPCVTAANAPNIRFYTAYPLPSGAGQADEVYTNAGLDALEFCRIDKDGNWGIHTTAPVNKITIVGGDNFQTNGPNLVLSPAGTNTTENSRIRFLESHTADFTGAYIHYDGSANRMHIGMHSNADQLAASDANKITFTRAANEIGINTNPAAAGIALHITGSIRNSALAGVGSRMVKTDASKNLVALAAGNVGQLLLNTGVWGTIPTPTSWTLLGNAGTDGGTANFMGTTDAVDFVLKTNNAEIMRVTSGGNVGIGTTAASEKLEICGNLKVIGDINASGLINPSQGIACSSDLRFKKDIQPLSNSLNNVLQLRGVNYYWKQEDFPEKYFTSTKQIGVIAQELEKIYPEIVFTEKNGYKSVDYARLTPILLEAVKELNATKYKLQKTIDSRQAAIAEQQKINAELNKSAELLEKEWK